MNIENEILLNPENPAVLVIRKTDKIKYFSVGLQKDQMLKKHKTQVPTILTVMKGEVEFLWNGKSIKLRPMDVFDIPVDEFHEVRGLEKENIFSLVQEVGT